MRTFLPPLLLMALAVPLAASELIAPIPIALAEHAVDAARQAYPNSPEKRREFIGAYRMAFLDLLRTSTDGARIVTKFSQESLNAGWAAGKAAKMANLCPDVSLEDFGYHLATIAGRARSNPDEPAATELVTTESTTYLLRSLQSLPPADGTIEIHGWVSPAGSYGKFGLWKHEVILVNP